MAKQRGIFNFLLGKKEVEFTTENGTTIYKDLDEFVYTEFGCRGISVFTSLEQLNVAYKYLKENLKEGYFISVLDIQGSKVYGFTIKNINKFHLKKDQKTGGDKKEYESLKTFYDMRYKIGSDELDIETSLKIINDTKFTSYVEGYTSKLRKEIVLEEKLYKPTIDSPPSMAPNIFSKPLVEFKNVQCYDACSFYPYLLTQPLPHLDKVVNLVSEEQLYEPNTAYYGKIIIKNLKAKNNYFPLTLVGKNRLGITIESQGKNIVNRGSQIISADEVYLSGFLKDLLTILKENYYFESYKISSKVIRFELKIDQCLRNKILEYFERKQEKKRQGIPYDGEKILLNRLYGFLITAGSTAPAHYGQYIVSQGRLIINGLIHEIGLKDTVQSHTDSIKFIGDHAAAIDKYNATVEFEELGKFVLEDVFQKCVYFSHITAKYINKKGELKFKHGGINDIGLKKLYEMDYDDIDQDTKFGLVKSYFYNEEGYFPNMTEISFKKSIRGEFNE